MDEAKAGIYDEDVGKVLYAGDVLYFYHRTKMCRVKIERVNGVYAFGKNFKIERMHKMGMYKFCGEYKMGMPSTHALALEYRYKTICDFISKFLIFLKKREAKHV